MHQLNCVDFLEWSATQIGFINYFFPFLQIFASDDWQEVFFLMNRSKSFPNTVVIVYQMIEKTWTNILIMFQNVSTDLCVFFRMVCNKNRCYFLFPIFTQLCIWSMTGDVLPNELCHTAFQTQWFLFTWWFKKLKKFRLGKVRLG